MWSAIHSSVAHLVHILLRDATQNCDARTTHTCAHTKYRFTCAQRRDRKLYIPLRARSPATTISFPVIHRFFVCGTANRRPHPYRFGWRCDTSTYTRDLETISTRGIENKSNILFTVVIWHHTCRKLCIPRARKKHNVVTYSRSRNKINTLLTKQHPSFRTHTDTGPSVNYMACNILRTAREGVIMSQCNGLMRSQRQGA